jgi:hypothetical protein
MRVRAATVVLTLLLAAPAAAAPLDAGSEPGGSQFLSLTGSGVTWLGVHRPPPKGSEARTIDVLRVNARPLATLGGFYPDEQDYYGTGVSVIALSASGSRAVITTEDVDVAKSKYTGNGTVATHTFLMDLASAAKTPVLDCGEFGWGNSALSGDLLATIGCSSSPSGGPLSVRNLTSSAAPAKLADGATAVRMTGSTVAAAVGAEYVVWNATDGTERQRIKRPTGPPVFSVDADGTLAYVANISLTEQQLLIAKPGAVPAVVAIAHAISAPRLVNGRLAFVRAASGLDEIILRPGDGSEVVVARRPLGGSGMDFDGTRIAFTRRDCAAGERVMVEEAGDRVTDEFRLDHCPVIINPYAEVDRRGRLTVTLTTPWLAPAIAGERIGVRISVFAGTRRVAGMTGSAPPSVYRNFRMKLKGRPKRVRVVVTSTSRGGSDEATRSFRPEYARRR